MPNNKIKPLQIEHEFLNTYLKYVHNTESPIIMHIWSAIASASACMARHVYLPCDIGDIYPNIFVLLVGPPGTRKSNSMKYAAKIVSEHTRVRFAPDDTGGQRQGLITALEGTVDDPLDKADEDLEMMDTAFATASLDELENIAMSTNAADAHHLFAWASEFGTLMGESNTTTTRLLNKIWDGEDYHYKLSKEQKVLKDPLMTILGGTTTTEIARILPQEAIGQGFMSRFVLVHASKREKRVPRPSLDRDYRDEIAELYNWLSYGMSGPMEESQEAADLADAIYEDEDSYKLDDTRFVYYQERRQAHLTKLAMVLAACRRSYVIEAVDVTQANELLAYTEHFMPDALGEFGLTAVGAAKQKMIEFLQQYNGPISASKLYSVMQIHMKQLDYKNALSALINADKISEVTTKEGQAFIYKDDLADIFEHVAVIGEAG